MTAPTEPARRTPRRSCRPVFTFLSPWAKRGLSDPLGSPDGGTTGRQWAGTCPMAIRRKPSPTRRVKMQAESDAQGENDGPVARFRDEQVAESERCDLRPAAPVAGRRSSGFWRLGRRRVMLTALTEARTGSLM